MCSYPSASFLNHPLPDDNVDDGGACVDLGTREGLPSCMFFSDCWATLTRPLLLSGWSTGCEVTAVAMVTKDQKNIKQKHI